MSGFVVQGSNSNDRDSSGEEGEGNSYFFSLIFNFFILEVNHSLRHTSLNTRIHFEAKFTRSIRAREVWSCMSLSLSRPDGPQNASSMRQSNG